MTIQTPSDLTSFDPYDGDLNNQIFDGYMDQIFMPSWTTDPSAQNYQLSFWTNDQAEGDLVQSWEFTTPGTLVLTVRNGIYWQDIAPSNGREFTATDIVDHFDRAFGLGNGYTKPGAYYATDGDWLELQSVTATGQFMVTMQWSTPNVEFIYENMDAPGSEVTIEDPDAVTAYNGTLDNWHDAIGTGPFLLTSFVDDTSATLTKNPNYWGYDERYPQNQLPYMNSIVDLIIPNQATALAALRAGKITAIDGIAAQDATNIQQTNPSIVQIPVPQGNAVTIDPRNDKSPYNNLQVREALQLAIDLPTIAQTYYNGKSESTPEPLTSGFMTGWGFPYSQWPASLQAEYAYNPTQAKQLLASAGYPNGFNTDIVVDQAADLDLLQIVQSYFSAIGVNMSIDAMPSAAFTAYVVVNHQNDALAMRTEGALGLTYYPIRQLTKFQTGASSNDAVVNDPTFNAFYTQALAATTTTQVMSIVTAANEYVAQQHFVISLLQPYQYALAQPWLGGFNDQYASISGYFGPLLLDEYGARFWINQSLETGS
jgi:peptide/nickel transport system substrate-binding protein